MLSQDELAHGITFILTLSDANGAAYHWVETLRGDTASRWYDIYRRSDWQALRAEAGDVFHRAVDDQEFAGLMRARGRRIVIHTELVRAEDVASHRGGAAAPRVSFGPMNMCDDDDVAPRA